MIWPIAKLMQARAGAIIAVLALGTAYVYHRVELKAADRAGYQRAQTEAKAEIEKLDAATAAREAEDREIARTHDIAYQEQTRDLQARLADLTRRNLDLGRLRQRPGSCPAPTRDASTAAIADGPAGDRGHAVQAAEDSERAVGIDLSTYGAECERYRQQVVNLQSWISETR